MKPARLVPACLVALILAGVWLVVAPFGLGYQPIGHAWTTATIGDMAAGGALALLAMASLLTYGVLGVRDLLATPRPTKPAEDTQ